jgi:hypothetical protein
MLRAKNTVAAIHPMTGLRLTPENPILIVMKSKSWQNAAMAKYRAGK